MSSCACWGCLNPEVFLRECVIASKCCLCDRATGHTIVYQTPCGNYYAEICPTCDGGVRPPGTAWKCDDAGAPCTHPSCAPGCTRVPWGKFDLCLRRFLHAMLQGPEYVARLERRGALAVVQGGRHPLLDSHPRGTLHLVKTDDAGTKT